MDGSAGISDGIRWMLHPRGPRVLLAVAALILPVFPGAPSLWTLEGRTGAICREMMHSGDYLHLFDDECYAKPLMSYRSGGFHSSWWLHSGSMKDVED